MGNDNSTQIDSVSFDFSKAFTKVTYERLLVKLHHYGVRGSLLDWIGNFLSTQSQQILNVVEVNFAPTAPVTSGAQRNGSWLTVVFGLY